jgi:hypothetical protein
VRVYTYEGDKLIVIPLDEIPCDSPYWGRRVEDADEIILDSKLVCTIFLEDY